MAHDGPALAVQVSQIEVEVKRLESDLRATQANSDDLAGAADHAERARLEQEGVLLARRAARDEKVAQQALATAKLEAARGLAADEALSDRSAGARATHGVAAGLAQVAAEEFGRATPELERGDVGRAQGAIDACTRSQQKLSDEALRVDTLLGVAAAEGRFEELADAAAEHLEAKESLARMEREAGAARLLGQVVEQAYAEAQRLFLEPVVKEAAPYLTKLRPGTEIRMNRDLKVDKVVRRGAEESFDELSGGTREQLSVIVRLALARVLARDKRPLPLILDDTMGWTDDARFLSMVQILRDASRDLQIIILTCHPSRFERFQADRWFDLDQLKGVPTDRGE